MPSSRAATSTGRSPIRPGPIAVDPNSQQAHAGLGNAHLRQNDVEGTIRDYGRSIALDGRDPTAFLDRAGAYLRQKRYPLAIADLDRVLELDPQNTGALVERAEARMATRDWDTALADLDAALRFAPDDADGAQALRLDPRAPVDYLAAARARSKAAR